MYRLKYLVYVNKLIIKMHYKSFQREIKDGKILDIIDTVQYINMALYFHYNLTVMIVFVHGLNIVTMLFYVYAYI